MRFACTTMTSLFLIFAGITLLLFGKLIYDLTTGRSWMRWGTYHRDRQPFGYWINVLLNVAAIGAIGYFTVQHWLQNSVA